MNIPAQTPERTRDDLIAEARVAIVAGQSFDEFINGAEKFPGYNEPDTDPGRNERDIQAWWNDETLKAKARASMKLNPTDAETQAVFDAAMKNGAPGIATRRPNDGQAISILPATRTHDAPMQTEAQQENIAQRTPLNFTELEKRGEPPARRWAIGGWWGKDHVTSLVGAGGIGKTLIAQQSASCLALGRNFIGDVGEPLRVLMWCCEDDHDELWRRQLAIAQWLDVPLSAFAENLFIDPRAGLENTLVAGEFGKLMLTPLLEELRQQAGDYRADCVILDNSAQLFGGNENDRHHVTSFLNNLIGILPGRAIMLLSHPARSTGSEYSGSGAWEAVVRTRLFLGSKLPDQQGDDDVPDDSVRFLCRRKANYSNKDYRRFQFKDGVLVPDEVEASAPSGMIDYLRHQKAERVVLDGLRTLADMKVRATDSANTAAFLPRLILEYKLNEGYTKRELADAMRQAMLDGKLIHGIVGKYANRTPMQGLIVAEA